MAEALSEYVEKRGSLGVLILLKTAGPWRFTDMANKLHISQSTLSERLEEARNLGLITPEIDEEGSSVDSQYRITERGQYLATKLEKMGIEHAYLTFLDAYHEIEAGRDDLGEWLDDEAVKEEIARQSEVDPYVDPFGHDVTRTDTNRRYR